MGFFLFVWMVLLGCALALWGFGWVIGWVAVYIAERFGVVGTVIFALALITGFLAMVTVVMPGGR